MQLTPVQVGGGDATQEGAIRISPATLQNIGVRTTEVPVESLSRRIRTTGRFEVNERRMTAVSPKVSGWVDQLYVDYEGARVQTGEPLFEIYSPELVATQEEYLTALRAADRLQGDAGAQRLVDAARRRLAYWDISEAQIERLKETREPQRTLTLSAPASGTVTRKAVTQGEKISAGQTLMHVTNLRQLWLMADVYEQDLSWVDVGTPAEVQLPYAPGRTVEGRVDYIYDEVDPETRTVKARITVPNPDRSLKPGMYATVTLRGDETTPTPVVPQEAVVSTGPREAVIRALGNGQFRPVPVTTGLSADGRTQVLRGLDGGEQVVTSAQFLIDSEARLQGALSAMTAGSHDHGGSATGRGNASPPDARSPEAPASRDKPAEGRSPDDHDGHGAVSGALAADSVQVAEVTIGPDGFSPKRVRLTAEIPAKLVFTRTTEATCATTVQVPAFDVQATEIPLTTPTAIRFTPDETGTFTFACGMDMITGTLVVQQ
jgi:RND family efflux transporter MFP subunit